MNSPPSARPRNDTRPIVAAVFVGVLYGLTLRVGFESAAFHPFLQIVSRAFLLLCPFSVGAIAVLWGAGKEKISYGDQVARASLAMLLFLMAMFAMFLEGLICIVLVLPVFLVAAIIGGLIGGLIQNHLRAHRSTLPVIALLPLLVGPIEAHLPAERSEQSVTSTLHIDAPPDAVFDRLADVRAIRREELGFTFVHFIGLPRPLEADMQGSGVGAVRTSRWEKNVSFQEVMTEWQRPVAMHYRFVIPPGSIPRDALDRHVEIGGEYFDVVDGGYDLKPTPDGGTDLSLTTRFVNKSQLKLYGDVWGQLVLRDFHRSILGLMKGRAERKG